MPKEEEWNEFFEPNKVLQLLGVNSSVRDVADFGCGYGTFTIPAARIIGGKIYALTLNLGFALIICVNAAIDH